MLSDMSNKNNNLDLTQTDTEIFQIESSIPTDDQSTELNSYSHVDTLI